jgi:TolB protein
LLVAAALAATTVSVARPSDRAASVSGLIAFASDRDGDFDIWTMRPDGSRLRKLTKNRLEDRCPSWSPNGRWIAYTRRGVHLPDLYVMRRDGSGVRRVAKLRGTETCPTWSRDGKRLVFTRFDTSSPDVFTIGINGRGLRRLTKLHDAWEIAASARTGRIAYECRYPPETGGNICTMRADGGDRRRLTNSVPTETYSHPAWSRDAGRLVFTDNREGNDDVFTMSASGSGVVRITRTGTNEADPDWSPDGRRLVWAGAGARGLPDLFVANADGSGVRRLTSWRRIDREPAWTR